MKFIKFSLFILFGLMFANAGLDKFLHYMPIPPMEPELVKVAEAFITIKWLLPLVGTIELIAGLMYLFPKTRFLAALMIFPITVAILIHNIIYLPTGLPIAAVFFSINIWVLILNKGRLKILVF